MPPANPQSATLPRVLSHPRSPFPLCSFIGSAECDLSVPMRQTLTHPQMVRDTGGE